MCLLCLFFFFFKQKTAYEMRISDWSSDVCSSDLLLNAGADYFHHATAGLGPELETDQVPAWGGRQKRRLQDSARYLDGALEGQAFLVGDKFTMEIGRASCRERVCQYV